MTVSAESSEQRSGIMRAVHSHDTAPELALRKLLRQMGEPGYRLHRTDIPGKPDVAFIGRKLLIFVHGCFWHGHDCRRGSRMPTTNADYWQEKIDRNRHRDRRHRRQLTLHGWRVLVVWECQLRTPDKLQRRLTKFLSG